MRRPPALLFASFAMTIGPGGPGRWGGGGEGVEGWDEMGGGGGRWEGGREGGYGNWAERRKLCTFCWPWLRVAIDGGLVLCVTDGVSVFNFCFVFVVVVVVLFFVLV